MDRTPAAFLVVVLFTLIAACAEPSPGPDPLRGPTFTVASGTECLATPDAVVRTWDEFFNQVTTASSGAVIAVDGMIDVAFAFDIRTPDLTITCATPGSGLRAPAGGGFILFVAGPRITVERLILDASAPGAAAYLAHNDPFNTQNRDSPRLAEDIRIVGNTIMCGVSNLCVVYGGFPGGPPASGAVVAGNHFTATGAETALLFHGVDGARVERNTFVGAGGALQGVRVQSIGVPAELGTVISTNVIAGSWVDALAVLNLERVQVAGNTVACGSNSCLLGVGTSGIVLADNRFESAGSTNGVHLQGWTNGAQVERNTIVSTAAAAEGVFASGIAIIGGGANVTVIGNVVTGPWTEAALLLQGMSGGRVEGNRLEGALDDGIDLFGSTDVQFVNNTVQCGASCFFADGSPRTLIVGNRFESAGSISGVHLQRGTDGDRIERNTIVATAPSTRFDFGGIRVRDGSNVVVADNVIRGPWSNSIAAANLAFSQFESNRLDGAGVNGIQFSVGPPLMTKNTFRNNQVTGAGSAGVFAQWACGNTFLGNSLEGNGRIPSAIFDATTGANVLVLLGNKNFVIDNGGGFDCDGDGAGDPNIITGPGRVRRGVPLGTPPAGTEGTTRLR